MAAVAVEEEGQSHGIKHKRWTPNMDHLLCSRQLGIRVRMGTEGGEEHLRVQHIIQQSLKSSPVFYDASLNWMNQGLVIALLERIRGQKTIQGTGRLDDRCRRRRRTLPLSSRPNCGWRYLRAR